MPQVLMILGAILVLAGMGSIAAGAPDWVLGLSLGATLIQSGTIGLVGGLVLIALGLVLSSLQGLIKRLDASPAIARRPPLAVAEPEHRMAAAPEPFAPPAASREQSADDPMQWPRDDAPPAMDEPVRNRREIAANNAGEQPARPRREQPAGFSPDDRPRVRRDLPASFPGEELVRPRRERSLEQTGEEIARLRGEHPAARRREESARPHRDMPPPPLPQSSRSDDRRRARASDDDQAESYVPRFRPAEPPSPPVRNPASETIVRSGVIGGMAYTLYADGSIEAELSIGTVRFGSIAELQEHVTRTGAEADVDFNESSN